MLHSKYQKTNTESAGEPPCFSKTVRCPDILIVMNAQRIYHTGNRHVQRHMKRIDDIGQMIESVTGIVWNDHAGSRIHSGCMRQNDQKSRHKFYCIVMARFVSGVPVLPLDFHPLLLSAQKQLRLPGRKKSPRNELFQGDRNRGTT